jgi:CPA1 family monovalent cation:H+ antiporter
MSIFNVIAIFISLVAIAAYINYRFVKLPTTIGLMIIGLSISLGLIGLSALGINTGGMAPNFIGSIDFSRTLMRGMLSFLLFAGALRINLNDLLKEKWSVGILATVGVIFSALAVGTVLFYLLRLLGIPLSYAYCLVFGALISPTDPVAVLAILRQIKVPKSLSTRIAGESLFNDGVGVVIFFVMLRFAEKGGGIHPASAALLFLREAGGGILLGLAIGYVVFRMLKKVDNYSVEILLTIALVSGGYALASTIGLSGPISIAVAGLLIGNHGRWHAMSEETRVNLDMFWELIDEFLNATLFIWIGLEMLVVSFTWDHLLAGAVAIPVVLGARFIGVLSMINLLRFRRKYSEHAARIMTWGGLRGGISIALALSLTKGEARDLIVPITYVVVVFSILVQGLTVRRMIKSETSKEGS